MPPIINKKKCVNCGYCAQICPIDVIHMEDKEVVVMYPDECWHCRACERDCKKQAITMRYPLSHLMLTIEPQKGGK